MYGVGVNTDKGSYSWRYDGTIGGRQKRVCFFGRTSGANVEEALLLEIDTMSKPWSKKKTE